MADAINPNQRIGDFFKALFQKTKGLDEKKLNETVKSETKKVFDTDGDKFIDAGKMPLAQEIKNVKSEDAFTAFDGISKEQFTKTIGLVKETLGELKTPPAKTTSLPELTNEDREGLATNLGTLQTAFINEMRGIYQEVTGRDGKDSTNAKLLLATANIVDTKMKSLSFSIKDSSAENVINSVKELGLTFRKLGNNENIKGIHNNIPAVMASGSGMVNELIEPFSKNMTAIPSGSHALPLPEGVNSQNTEVYVKDGLNKDGKENWTRLNKGQEFNTSFAAGSQSAGSYSLALKPEDLSYNFSGNLPLAFTLKFVDSGKESKMSYMIDPNKK